MNVFQSICLGLLQGITEFLPVSSSGHLAVVQHFFNLEDIPLIFDICLHVATLFAVLLFFRNTIFELIAAFIRMIIRKPLPDDKPKQMMIFSIIVATVITGLIGVFFSGYVKNLSIKFVCAGFIITGLLLILATFIDKKNKNAETTPKKPLTIMNGVWCGLAQGLGTLPGISRSGSTISGALLSGIDRQTAGEYSFLLSIPAILGAFLLELRDLDKLLTVVPISSLALGCICAFVSGLGALFLLMKLIKHGKLGFFAIYLIPLGIIGLFLF
ncbi:MAG: undecaprenyl-diphosphate phosphatase [Treponema sp.]|jgi:undecaprenyl-diphosphatase|nr:undecaprenyl-diphosphate phosphatase [Treponema sp.]